MPNLVLHFASVTQRGNYSVLFWPLPGLSDLFCFAWLFFFDADSSPLADAPDEFDTPLALLPVVPEVPAAPAAPEPPAVDPDVDDGVSAVLDAPVLPELLVAPLELPAPVGPAVAPFDVPVADGEDEPEPLCASAIDDTEAINTKDMVRIVVFKLMKMLLGDNEKSIVDAGAWMKQHGRRSGRYRSHGLRLRVNTLQAVDFLLLIDCVKVCNPAAALLRSGCRGVRNCMKTGACLERRR
ncbi:hypothetical protein [Noviherbaspirillum sp.]|uniref:hypothetical protein n=1 Tax=Noviherbaspirillum sp. TaxID=1926288 RepID=UPI002FE12F7A